MYKKMILFIQFISFIMVACTKQSAPPIPNNPNIEYRVLDTTFSRFYFEYDFDYNGVREMIISTNFKPDNGDGLENAGGLILIPNGFVQNFDVMDTLIICGSDTLKYAKKLNLGDSIYYTPSKWIANKPHNGGLNLFSYEKFLQQGINKQCGYYNMGDFYLPIRFYGRFDYGEGWFNAWLLIHTTDKNLTIKSVAWYKSPNTPIKAGEK